MQRQTTDLVITQFATFIVEVRLVLNQNEMRRYEGCNPIFTENL